MRDPYYLTVHIHIMYTNVLMFHILKLKASYTYTAGKIPLRVLFSSRLLMFYDR